MCYIFFHKIFVFGKESKTINKFLSLSDKYACIRPLGSGESANVFLIRHLYLDAEYAMKVSPKDEGSAQRILEEGKFLKSLNHPGIPRIYDYFEDDDYVYLVEEFLDGESISELFLHQPVISLKNFYSYALQLCDIFIYLHKCSSDFCYQDLKPEHVILCGNQLKLIDFCVNCFSSETTVEISGNKCFSAPEVLSGGNPTTLSDIFTLGSFLQYLLCHVEEVFSQKLNSILETATAADPVLRYETVEALKADLLHLSEEEIDEFEERKERISCKNIAIIGSFHGCGATHFGIALTSCLNFLGYTTIFFEKDGANTLRILSENNFPFHRQDGIYRYRHFTGIPEYGPGIVLDIPKADYAVTVNNTTVMQNFKSSDIILLLGDGSPWCINKCIDINETLLPYRDRVKVICTSNNKANSKRLSKALSMPVYQFRDDSDAFCVTKKKLSFFEKLLQL
ncbi:MAG: hypothetical protein E7282_05500 [Lachnospiraceae bacterium]|nr:hypothetical protein [Lachnospiraceae bacterium]